MRHILAMAILGASLALTTSAALAGELSSSVDGSVGGGITMRSWDGVVVEPQQMVLYGPSGSAVAGSPERKPYWLGGQHETGHGN